MGMSGFERGLVSLVTLTLIVLTVMWIGVDVRRYRVLIRSTLIATFVLVVLGAFVRLSDAGLGCPDWPGCYGNLTPHHAGEQIRAAEITQPGGPVSMAKAWKEMVHRYLAMLVGALIAAIMVSAWRNRRQWQQSPAVPTVLAGAVIFQAALGAWTVTMLLKPAIVTSHLLGGIFILSLLAWLLLRVSANDGWARAIVSTSPLRLFAAAALAILLAQIVLGGWVSTNYAALACADLPTCHGAWVPAMDFANAFHVIRPLGLGPDGELLTVEALRAIHWTHRVGAIVTLFVVGGFVLALMRQPSGRKAARMLLVMLVLQLVLGLGNVWLQLPLATAVAHNGIAAALFAWLLVVNLRMSGGEK